MTQKSMEDKLGALEKQLQKMTRDVNAELSGWATFPFLLVIQTIVRRKLTIANLVDVGFRETVGSKFKNQTGIE